MGEIKAFIYLTFNNLHFQTFDKRAIFSDKDNNLRFFPLSCQSPAVTVSVHDRPLPSMIAL